MTDRVDNFTRADTTNNIGTPSDGGSAWVQQSGTWGINTNQGYISAGASQATCVLESSVTNVAVQVTWATQNTDDGLVARAASDTDYLLMTLNISGGTFLYKKVANSFTQLASNATNFVSGDVAKLTVSSANLITAFKNGASYMSATDAAGSANTKHGLRANSANATSRFASFSITDLNPPASGQSAVSPMPFYNTISIQE